jgi:hypothetical protein
MTELPKSAHSRMQAGQGSVNAHPNADMLNAFLEKALLSTEREQVMEHLAVCPDCREIVSISVPAEENANRDVGTVKTWFGTRWTHIRWGAAAASAVVIVAAVITLRPGFMDTERSKEVRSEKISANQIEESKDTDLDTFAAKKAPSSPRAEVEQKRARVASDSLTVQSKERSSGVEDILGSGNQKSEKAKAGLASGSASAGLRQEQGYGYKAQSPGGSTQTFGGFGGTFRSQNQAPAPLADKAESANVTGSMAAEADGKSDQAAFAVAQAKPAPESEPIRRYDALARAAADTSKTKQNEAQSSFAPLPPVETKDEKTTADSAAPPNPSASQTIVVTGASQSVGELRETNSRPSRQMFKIAGEGAFTWRIHKGSLQRSRDAGPPWQDIKKLPIPGDAALTVIASVPAKPTHVWVGGSNGLVLHSADNGETWSKVSGGWTGNVLSIEFEDALRGELLTSTGEQWTTSDGGVSWKKK